MASVAAVRGTRWKPTLNDQNDLECLHTLGALVAGNLAPGAVPAEQWPAITTLALQHGLAPMLHWTLKQARCDIEGNPAWRPLIAARYQTGIDWALKERAQLEIDAALRAAGIPAIWLKGSVLARTVYPEPSLRPMTDLDVLVPYEQREAALEILQEMGFDFYMLQKGKRPISSEDDLRQKLSPHHYPLRGGLLNSVKVELHFRLLGADDVLPLNHLQRIVKNQQEVTLKRGATFHSLTSEAHLVYLAAHAILQHGEGNLYLLRYLDLHRLITQTPPSWATALDIAVSLKWTYVLERGLLNAAEYFNTLVPPEVFEALVTRRPPGENPMDVVRFQGRWHEWELFHRKLNRLPLKDKLRVIFMELVPTRSYMRQFYGIRGGHPVWPYYIRRWLNRGYKAMRLTGERLVLWGRSRIVSIAERKP